MSDTSPGNNPSRRLFIAAGSAGAVFGALSSAVAAGDDPVFAAIAEQRRCKALSDEALAVCNRINDELHAARDAIAVIHFDGEQYYTLSHLDGELGRRGRLSGDEITAFFNARRALVEHEAAFRKAFDESGIAEAEDAFGDKNTAYFDAEMAVLSTPPTTAAGSLALLAFIAEHLEGPHSDPGEYYPEPLLGAMRNVLAVLKPEALA